MTATTIIHSARKIITMNRSRPEASHVAVREGRILGVGSLEELAGWGDYRLDETFKDLVLMPGLVEGHSHSMEGGVWDHIYVGYFDRRDPDGRLWPGLKTMEAVIGRLREAEAAMDDAERPLFAWGLDPIFFGNRRMSVADLDKVSTTRPIAVNHASLHLINVNGVVLERAGIGPDTDAEGVMKDPDGRPSGEMAAFAGRYIVFRVTGEDLLMSGISDVALRRFGRSANRVGVTTMTDLVNPLSDDMVEKFLRVTGEETFPARVVPALGSQLVSREEGVERLQRLRPLSTEKLRFGLVKMVVDGSIQGFTARLRWPGYYNGNPKGLWYQGPEELRDAIETYHAAGGLLHIHTNGDEATELAIDTVEAVLRERPRWDHRYTLQHCQMADEAQFRRMARLGMCANLFANHVYYWGDAHYETTMGPDRAERMDAAATAIRAGVPFALHSDAPITPLAPLFTAWCAVNRVTLSGRVLGAAERIPVDDALRAITLGAAFTLKLDGEIGSIEVGKRADFAVLEDDPTAVAPEALKDVRVWGTVLGGRIFPAAADT